MCHRISSDAGIIQISFRTDSFCFNVSFNTNCDVFLTLTKSFFGVKILKMAVKPAMTRWRTVWDGSSQLGVHVQLRPPNVCYLLNVIKSCFVTILCNLFVCVGHFLVQKHGNHVCGLHLRDHFMAERLVQGSRRGCTYVLDVLLQNEFRTNQKPPWWRQNYKPCWSWISEHRFGYKQKKKNLASLFR